jgi:hypothetical protein
MPEASNLTMTIQPWLWCSFAELVRIRLPDRIGQPTAGRAPLTRDEAATSSGATSSCAAASASLVVGPDRV